MAFEVKGPLKPLLERGILKCLFFRVIDTPCKRWVDLKKLLFYTSWVIGFA